MTMLAAPTEVGTIDVTFRTRFADEGYESPVPREMWIDVSAARATLSFPRSSPLLRPLGYPFAQAPAVRYQRSDAESRDHGLLFFVRLAEVA